MQAIFPNGELNDGDFRKAAAAMKVVVNGYAGAGTIEYGGRDYHQDPRPETDGKDFVVGQAIGASLEYAAQLGKPLMVYVLQRRLGRRGHGQPGRRRQRHDQVPLALGQFADGGQLHPGLQPERPTGAAQRGRVPAARLLPLRRQRGNGLQPLRQQRDALAELVVLNYLGLHGQEGMFGAV